MPFPKANALTVNSLEHDGNLLYAWGGGGLTYTSGIGLTQNFEID